MVFLQFSINLFWNHNSLHNLVGFFTLESVSHMSLPTQDSGTEENTDMHKCFEWHSKTPLTFREMYYYTQLIPRGKLLHYSSLLTSRFKHFTCSDYRYWSCSTSVTSCIDAATSDADFHIFWKFLVFICLIFPVLTFIAFMIRHLISTIRCPRFRPGSTTIFTWLVVIILTAFPPVFLVTSVRIEPGNVWILD
jgi:hypothetical protein